MAIARDSFHWTDDAKREAALHYAITGTLKLTSQFTGIPETTILSWLKGHADKDGIFNGQLELARTQRASEFTARFERVAEQGLERISERLSDDAEAAKVSVRDLSMVAGIAIDKSLILSNRSPKQQATQGIQELATHVQ